MNGCDNPCQGLSACTIYDMEAIKGNRLLYNQTYYCDNIPDELISGIYAIDMNAENRRQILAGDFTIMDISEDDAHVVTIREDVIHLYELDDQLAIVKHSAIPKPGITFSYPYYPNITISPTGDKIVLFEISNRLENIDMALHFFQVSNGQIQFIKSLLVNDGYYDPDVNIHLAPLAQEDFTHPVWSKDGGKLAFVKNGDVFTVEGNGASLWNRTKSENQFDQSPAWSPVDNVLAFVRGIAPPASIDLLDDDEDASMTMVISDELNGFGRLTWSPDGAKLAFFGSLNSIESFTIFNTDVFYLANLESAMFFINVDGSGLTRISNDFLPFIEWVN